MGWGWSGASGELRARLRPHIDLGRAVPMLCNSCVALRVVSWRGGEKPEGRMGRWGAGGEQGRGQLSSFGVGSG